MCESDWCEIGLHIHQFNALLFMHAGIYGSTRRRLKCECAGQMWALLSDGPNVVSGFALT